MSQIHLAFVYFFKEWQTSFINFDAQLTVAFDQLQVDKHQRSNHCTRLIEWNKIIKAYITL